MSKTYLLEEAKELVKNGTHQIYKDCPEKIKILREISQFSVTGNALYYSNNGSAYNQIEGLEIIPLSAIEDIKWGNEAEFSDSGIRWTKEKFCSKNPFGHEYISINEKEVVSMWNLIRKPVPNFSALIQSTQEAADKIQKGYVVKIEKL